MSGNAGQLEEVSADGSERRPHRYLATLPALSGHSHARDRAEMSRHRRRNPPGAVSAGLRALLRRSLAARRLLPSLVGQVGAVQLIGAPGPARHHPVLDLPGAFVVVRLDEVDHLVDDDAFETRQRLPGQCGVE